jgi:sugar phosphate isomerase/epimerase
VGRGGQGTGLPLDPRQRPLRPRLPFEEQQKLAADGLRRLSEFAAPHGLNVIVENHGGLSSNGKWLAGVMKLVDRKNCGTLPDFGNFRIVERRRVRPLSGSR